MTIDVTKESWNMLGEHLVRIAVALEQIMSIVPLLIDDTKASEKNLPEKTDTATETQAVELPQRKQRRKVPKAEPEPEQPQTELADESEVRDKVIAYGTKNGRQKVLQLFEQISPGAKRLPDIPSNKYPALMKAMESEA